MSIYLVLCINEMYISLCSYNYIYQQYYIIHFCLHNRSTSNIEIDSYQMTHNYTQMGNQNTMMKEIFNTYQEFTEPSPLSTLHSSNILSTFPSSSFLQVGALLGRGVLLHIKYGDGGCSTTVTPHPSGRNGQMEKPKNTTQKIL